jgi:hypothetical protein
MKKIGFILIAAMFLGVTYSSAQKPVDKIAYKLVDDFETGEKFAWQPYPYEQDVGTTRHFYTRTSPTHNDSKWALWSLFRANDGVEAENGFVKELNFWTVPQTRVKVAVFFQSDRNPDHMELSLGTFDGRRYMHPVSNPKANRWLELDIPISEFRLNGKSLGAGEHIQVVTLGGGYKVTYYLHQYNIMMDDFMINGERQRRFVGKNPVSIDFEMFDVSILNKHYFYGDNITLSVSPEGNVPLTQVRGTLIDSKGKVVKDNIVFAKKGTEWVNDAIHQVSNGDALGQWEIRLTGATSHGTEVNWGFKFLVPGKRVNGHPRIQFTTEELKNRLANENSPVAKRILDKALEDKDFMKINIDSVHQFDDIPREGMASSTYGKYSSMQGRGSDSWRGSVLTPAEVAYEGSMRYAFTGDLAAAEQAKKALLKLCSYTQWTNNWMLDNHNYHWYPNGEFIRYVGYGYDILYNLMTDAERKLVRNAITEMGLKMNYRDMVELNRMPANVTNHIAVITGGMGIAAAAIYGDDPSNPYLEPYMSGLITRARTFIGRTYYEDGSYGEPNTGYMNFATQALAEFMGPLERTVGVDLATTTKIQNFQKFQLQASYSNGKMQDFGDAGGPDGVNSTLGRNLHSQFFVYRTGDPLVYPYVKLYWEAGNGGYLGYLWFRDDITPVSRETVLPLSKIFSADGMIMRSGWDDHSTIINMRIGPNSNHYHRDQGSFQIMTNGETLFTDPGVGPGGYYNNMEYQPYNIQAIGHNVMLVDNDAESQEPADYDIGIAALRDWPKVVNAFAGKIADAIEGDLATVYKKKLATYTRTLLYTKSGPLFLFDKVKSSSPDGHTYDWLFHAAQNGDKRSINYSKNQLTIDRPNARLTMNIISPVIAATRIRDRNENGESFINLTSKPNLAEANFFAVIMPEGKPATGDYAARLKTTRMDAQGWIGAKVERQNAVDFGFFRTADNAAGIVGGFTTDAKRFTASYDGSGAFVKAYFEGGSFSGNGISVRSDVPVTCAIMSGTSGTELEVQSDRAAALVISLAKQPARVLLNGSEVRTTKYDAAAKTLTVQVPVGRNDFSIQ